MFDWIKKRFRKGPDPPCHKPVRKKMDIDSIRNRIKSLGWNLRELPIRKSNPDPQKRVIVSWKLTAFKKERSVEASGETLIEAMENIGQTLGVISRK